MAFELDENLDLGVCIKVVGVGGGGNNAVNRMIQTNIRGVEFLAINTDKQALIHSNATYKLPIGEKITKGFGAGSNPEVGQHAAEESIDELKKALEGADMVFVTAGMGGGTGTGAAPIVAKTAREMGILTIGIVTKPFAFEGKRRMQQAEAGIANLRDYVDSLVIIPNERLKQVSETRITLLNAFEVADDVLRRGVQSISELINVPGFINLDFNDVTSVMANAGYAHMGIGMGTGKDKAENAAKEAISSPLLESTIDGASGIIVSITASPDIGLEEVDLASTMIADAADPEANIIWGASFDPNLEDAMRITVIATGFNKENYHKTGEEIAAAAAAKAAEAAASKEASDSSASAYTVYDPAKDNEIGEGTKPEIKEEILAETDFDDILNILKKSNRRDDIRRK